VLLAAIVLYGQPSPHPATILFWDPPWLSQTQSSPPIPPNLHPNLWLPELRGLHFVCDIAPIPTLNIHGSRFAIW
jgi:hypothetical protein